MKRFLPIFLCAALAFCLLGGCGTNQKSVRLNDLRSAMLDAADLPEMLSAGSGDSSAERELTALTDIPYDKVEEFFIDYAADGKAYEIAVIRLKDEKDAEQVEKDLRDHIRSRVQQYQYYMPEQTANAEHAVVAVKGAYAALMMCDDPSAVKAAFDGAFS